MIKTTPTTSKQETHPSAGIFVLQWLTYAFWGWLIGALIWLVNLSFTNLLLDNNTSDSIPYALAAGIVLLPVAFITDLFYRRHEPTKKTSASMVIMVIHAVLFALITIAALVTAVFLGLNILINGMPSYNEYQTVFLFTALFAAVAFGLVFLRTLNPFRTKRLGFWFSIGALIVALGLITWGLAGPTVRALTLREDRLIENNLMYVTQSVVKYVQANDKLPESLTDTDLSIGDAKTLVDSGAVEYKPEGLTTIPATENNDAYSVYRYQLCVTFTEESQNRSGVFDTSYPYENDGYTYSPGTYDHDAGDVCYKLQSDSTSDNPEYKEY